MTDCPRFGKWFRPCAFNGRYDKGAPVGMEGLKYTGGDTPQEVTEAFRPITYVRDVCWCGKTVERQK